MAERKPPRHDRKRTTCGDDCIALVDNVRVMDHRILGGEKMELQQTKHFKIDVDHLVSYGKEIRYLIGREQKAADLLNEYEHFRGS